MQTIATKQTMKAIRGKREYVLPFIIVACLFFIWGFITNMNGLMLNHIKFILQLNTLQVEFVNFTFFAIYFTAAIPAGIIINKIGYKHALFTGLWVASLGALIIYVSALSLNFTVLLIGLSGLAAGITFLQIAANAYICIAGKSKYAAARLCLAGAINSIGAAMGPYIGNLLAPNYSVSAETSYGKWIGSLAISEKAYYINHEANAVKGPYIMLAVILLLLALSVVFNYIPSSQQFRNRTKFNWSIIKKKQLWLGVIGIFCYVGAEVGVFNHLDTYFDTYSDNTNEALKQFSKPIYMTLAMIGRVIGFVVLYRMKSKVLLTRTSIFALLLLIFALINKSELSFYAILSVGLCNSVMFPIIYVIAIRGFQKDTITASSFLTMGIVGGAIIPFIMTLLGGMIQIYTLTLLIPIACYLFILLYTQSNPYKKSIKVQ